MTVLMHLLAGASQCWSEREGPPRAPSNSPRDPVIDLPENAPRDVPTDPPVTVPADVPFDPPGDPPSTDDRSGLPMERPPQAPDDFPAEPAPG